MRGIDPEHGMGVEFQYLEIGLAVSLGMATREMERTRRGVGRVVPVVTGLHKAMRLTRPKIRALIESLKPGDQLFGEGLAGFGPQETAADATVLFCGQSKGQQHLDVLLDALLRDLVEFGVFEGVVHDPGVSRPKSMRMWPFCP